MILMDRAKYHPEKWRVTKWSHLWDSENDTRNLHRFARQIELKRGWFQNRAGFPHYDISGVMVLRAHMAGASKVSLKDWLRQRPQHEGKKEGGK